MMGKEVLGKVVVGVREAECDGSKHEEIEGGGGVALSGGVRGIHW